MLEKMIVTVDLPQRTDPVSTRYNAMLAERQIWVFLDKELEFEVRNDGIALTNQTSESYSMNAISLNNIEVTVMILFTHNTETDAHPRAMIQIRWFVRSDT